MNELLKESKVGKFWIQVDSEEQLKNGDVKIITGQKEPCVEETILKQHSNLWRDKVIPEHPELRHLLYDYYPRGKVDTINEGSDIAIFLNKMVNTPQVVCLIMNQFDLPNDTKIIQYEDIHKSDKTFKVFENIYEKPGVKIDEGEIMLGCFWIHCFNKNDIALGKYKILVGQKYTKTSFETNCVNVAPAKDLWEVFGLNCDYNYFPRGFVSLDSTTDLPVIYFPDECFNCAELIEDVHKEFRLPDEVEIRINKNLHFDSFDDDTFGGKLRLNKEFQSYSLNNFHYSIFLIRKADKRILYFERDKDFPQHPYIFADHKTRQEWLEAPFETLKDDWKIQSEKTFQYFYRNTLDLELKQDIATLIEAKQNDEELTPELLSFWKDVDDRVNNEFIRFSLLTDFTGTYDKCARVSNHRATFRIESNGVDWYPILFQFMSDNRYSVTEITVSDFRVKKDGSFEDVYKYKGIPIYKMSYEDFITLPGRVEFL